MPKGRGFGTAVFVVSLLATIQTLLVNTMGFLDAFTGSAFGCGHQWFLCNGRMIPIIESTQTLIEFFHRVGVPILTVLILVAAVSASVRYRKWIEIPIFSALSVFFVLLEALLGGLAVIFNEPPSVIATHFGVSLLAFSSILLLTIYIRRVEHVRERSLELSVPQPLRQSLPNRPFRVLAWVSIPILYLAMYVGAYISSSGVGDSFKGWPLPTETASAPNHALMWDYTHRAIALFLICWMIALVIKGRQMSKTRRDIHRGTWVALGFIVLQALSGIQLVNNHNSIPAFLLHVTIVTGLFGTLCFLAVQTLPAKRRTDQNAD